jgi:hypothetical protein
MTDTHRGPGQTPSVLTSVILPFVESSDARLRSNAMHALAALVTKSDQNLANQAEKQLLRALMLDFGSAGAEWQRRFWQSAFDALGRIPEEARIRIANEADKNLINTRDPAERARIAGLLIALRAAGCLPAAGWSKMLRLTFDAGRAGLLRTVWAVIWRMAVATLLFGCAIFGLSPVSQVSGENIASRLFDVWILGSLCLIILMYFSLSGKAIEFRRLWSFDIIMSAIIFSILAGVGRLLLDNTGARDGWPLFEKAFALLDGRSLIAAIEGCLLGFLIGGAIRSMRWIVDVYVIEAAETKSVSRAMLAVLVTTLACWGAAVMGMDPHSAGAAWVVLVPTSAAASLLDVWLERQPPQSLLLKQKKYYVSGTVQSAIIIAAAALALITYFRDGNRVSGPSFDQVAISFPADSIQNGKKSLETGFGVPAQFEITGTDTYQIQITAEAPGDPVLRIFNKKLGDRLVAEVSQPVPKYLLGEGQYYACVVKFKSTSRTICDQFSIIDIAALLIGHNATPLESNATENKARDVTITLSPIRKTRSPEQDSAIQP